MASAPFETNRWWFAAEAMTAAAMVLLTLALGGAPEWSTWLLLLLSAAATGTWFFGAFRPNRRWSWHPVLWLPVMVGALELLQLVPLPPFMLQRLSPRAAELRDTALVPLGLTQWRPVSIDAPSTFRALARTVALAGLLFTSLQLGKSDRSRRRLYSVAGGLGALLAIIGFVHLLAGFDTLLGFYQFTATTPLMSPFGNSNHLASALTLCSTVALGLALTSKRRDSAIGWAVMALAMGVATFLSFSRGGIAALMVTWALVAGYYASRGTTGLRGAFPWLAIASVIVGAGLLAFDQLATRVDTLSTLEKIQATKIDLWPALTRAAWAFGPLGMGVGAFELAFSPWQTQQLNVTFTHPENLWFQWATEAGLPFSMGLLALTWWLTRRLWSDLKGSRLEAVVMLAIVGVLLHDTFDFSLELNALPTLAAVLLGLVASVAPERIAPRQPIRARHLAVLVSAVVVAVVAARLAHPTHLAAEHQLQRATRDPAQLKNVPGLARSTIDRHPADWVLYATMANITAGHGDAQNALAWVNRWLWLRPNDAHAHLAAAQALLRLGARTQALLEFRTAFELGDDSQRTLDVALAVASVEHDYERLFIDRPKWLETAWRRLAQRDPAEAQVLLEQASASPVSEAMKREAQWLWVQALETQGRLTEALQMLDSLPPAEQEEAVLIRARLLKKLARTDDAIALLEKRTTLAPGSVEVAYALAEVLASTGRTAAARAALARVQPFVGQTSVRSELFQREAALWAADGRHAKALDAWVTASLLEPTRADLHYRVAQAYEVLGSYISAIDEVKKGREVDSAAGAAAQQAWLDRLQAAQLNRTAAAHEAGADAPRADDEGSRIE